MVFARRPPTVTTRRRPTADNWGRRAAGFDRDIVRAAAATTSHPVKAMAGFMSDHSFVGQRLDLRGRHAEQLSVDVLVVLAVARRAAVQAAADPGRALAHLDRDLREGPAADLRARHLG